jgi:hypothetical protein
MKITDDDTDLKSLELLGRQATALLRSGDFAALAKRFGYAAAFERDPAFAIREDLLSSLTGLGAAGLGAPPAVPPSVSYFKPNDDGLFALVEQRVPTDNGSHVLLELIVTSRGPDKYVVLEQISDAA